MLGLWPGGKELPGKKHRPGGPRSEGLRPASAAYGGLIGRPAGRPYPERTPSSEVQTVGPPGPGCGSCLMVFVREILAPGPGTKPKATFRWRPFQSARGRVSSTLSGSRFFIPPPLVEVMISPRAPRPLWLFIILGQNTEIHNFPGAFFLTPCSGRLYDSFQPLLHPRNLRNKPNNSLKE